MSVKDPQWCAEHSKVDCPYHDYGDDPWGKLSAEAFITATYGPRCETTDKEDFPDSDYDDPKNMRCPTCEMWEMYDDWRASIK